MSDSKNQNPLDETKVEDQAKLEAIYDEKDKEYLSFLQQRLESAKIQKEQPYPELNGKTIYQYYEENEKIANTNHLDPKKNPDDVSVSAGTIESKLDSLLSHINNLNLSPEVFAFNENNDKVVSLGVALEDIIHETEIRDGADGAGDEEKKLLRQRELLKQGTVFVQEEWVRRFEMKKKLKGDFDGKFKQDAEFYSKSLELVFEGPSRTLLHMPNVFLGDLTQFYMEDQPYVFAVIRTAYENSKGRYGKFENFKYVQAGKIPANPANTSSQTGGASTIFDNKWRLTEIEDHQVEIILYQDKPNDEFQIIINGVLMLPIGFPLSAVSAGGAYNIAKQCYRVFNDKFAYGGSFVSSGSVKELSALIDEMLKLFVLKTRKSITPAYVNTSGRVIDKKVLMPGRISMGLDAQSLVPIAGNEVQGVTAGEANFLMRMQELVDKSTVSDQFTGQQGPAGTTATEASILQQQAQLTLGLTVAACMFLEKKLAWLRLHNILANWFEPNGSRVMEIEGARKELTSTYRKTTRTNANIPGEGPGERSVILEEGSGDMDPEIIRAIERREEEEKGVPVRKIYIDPKALCQAKVYWYIVVNSRQRESSPLFKSMFREMINDLIALTQIGSIPNKDGIEEEFAQVWGKPRSKLFQSASMNPALAGVSGAGNAPGQSSPAQAPNMGGAPMVAGGLSPMSSAQ